MLATLAFYVFALLLLGSAAMVVTARNPVHSVLFLIVGFFNAAGLFLLTGAEFLAMLLVIVYVGAVAVLFLFVVMMLDVKLTRTREGFQRYAPIGATIGVILLVELGFVLGGWHFAPQAPLLRFAPATMPTPGSVALSNTAQLGDLIYTRYVLLFQLAGLVLLVAMIGAIVLTLRDRREARRQNIARQIARTPAETLETVRIPLGAGVDAIGIYRPIVPALPDEHDAPGATNPDIHVHDERVH